MMGKMCGSITGILALAAGVFLYMGGMTMYAGIALALFGLSYLVHAMGMCPNCGEDCCCEMEEKPEPKRRK